MPRFALPPSAVSFRPKSWKGIPHPLSRILTVPSLTVDGDVDSTRLHISERPCCSCGIHSVCSVLDVFAVDRHWIDVHRARYEFEYVFPLSRFPGVGAAWRICGLLALCGRPCQLLFSRHDPLARLGCSGGLRVEPVLVVEAGVFHAFVFGDTHIGGGFTPR